MAQAARDQNFVPTLLAVSSVDGVTPVVVYANPITHRLLTDNAGGGSGTVTSVSVATANGFAGTVATATTTPAITLSTTITGILKGDGTAISAATAGTDYTALAFKTIAVSGQSDIVADTAADTLTIAAGTNITITTNAATDTLTISGPATTGFATTALDNLASVSINTALLAQTGVDLGSTTKPFRNAFFFGGGTYGTTYFELTGTPTSTRVATFPDSNTTIPIAAQLITFAGLTSGRTVTLPDANITVARTDAANTFTGASTASAWVLTSPTITTKISPTSDDGAPLGDATHNFSDLFLASGALINIANGNWVATHTSGILTVTTGDLRVTSANVGTNGDSVPTLSSTSTLTNKTLTSPTLTTPSAFTTGGTITLAENTSIALDPAGSADGKYTGITVTGIGGATIAFGDLITLDKDDSRWELVDISVAAAATGDARGIMGMAVTSSTDGGALTILLHGIIRADANFPALTIGAAVYASTAGDIIVAQPSTVDYVIRIVGSALTADEIYFNPDNSWITHT